jgi:hypothetical protein
MNYGFRVEICREKGSGFTGSGFMVQGLRLIKVY